VAIVFGLTILSFGTKQESEQSQVKLFFQRFILPMLTPLMVDPTHPFPFIRFFVWFCCCGASLIVW
jgi:polyphosphate kinase